jgi:hypothetical protein
LPRNDPKLKVVLKDFPILGPDSVEASRVAVAAKNQLQGAKYFEFHNKLMGVKGRVNGAKALEIAKDAGRRRRAPEEGHGRSRHQGGDRGHRRARRRLGLTGTPAFILGDEVVFGAVGAGRPEAEDRCRPQMRQGDLQRLRLWPDRGRQASPAGPQRL